MNSLTQKQISLAQYTSWRVGGEAKQYYRPRSITALSQFLRTLPKEEPLFWLGQGSNVLISDEGFAGTVVHIHKALNNIELIEEADEHAILRIEAGATCAKLTKFCLEHSLAGAEFLAGIPGTVGGALVMNAGAFGNEIWQYVESLEMINRKGDVLIRKPQDFSVGYRKVVIPDKEWFIAAHLYFNKGNAIDIKAKVRELLERRKQSQPIGELSCGSVFCNPPGLYAARLIEASGLKGKSIGGAVVSMKHANFIINYNKATAKDIEDLIKFVQNKVFQDHGVMLKTEVKIVRS